MADLDKFNFEFFVSGYIRIDIQASTAPMDIIGLISKYSSGLDGELIVKKDETKILKSDHQYEFTFVRIESGGILTTNPWNSMNQKGGKLLIKAINYFLIQPNGKVVLDSLGYKSGDRYSQTGESYNSPSKNQGIPNLGGGGTFIFIQRVNIK